MKTTNFFIVGLLLAAGSAFGQVVQTSNTTGLGKDNGGAFVPAGAYGNNSTFLGVLAGRWSDPSTGNPGGNTFVGHETGMGDLSTGVKPTGSQNSFFGFQAGRNFISASRNTFLGYQSGIKNSAGNNNVFAGFLAGENTNADANTFLGSEAGRINGKGTFNVFVGNTAGWSNTDGKNNTFVGNAAGYKTIGTNNSFFGGGAGYGHSTGDSNCFFGINAGSNTTGTENIFMGFQSGVNAMGSSYNVFIGNHTGGGNTGNGQNVFVGHAAGASNVTGYGNVLLGSNAGFNSTGYQNVFVGQQAGADARGYKNVFIGLEAGRNEPGNNKLYIANSNTPTPLIYGDFASGKVGIGGTPHPSGSADGFPTTAGSVNVGAYKLFVKGGILTEEVRVSLVNTWADYVFADEYKLATLPEVEQYIAANGHLPNVPSAKQVKEDGIALGDMSRIQQEKIEELTLYAIQQHKQLTEQSQQLEQQQKEIDELKAAVKTLMAQK